MAAELEEIASTRVLPRFSIRALIGILTIFAVVSLIAGTAYRGQYWAWGVTIGILSLGLTALVHAAFFGIVWLFSRIVSDGSEKTP